MNKALIYLLLCGGLFTLAAGGSVETVSADPGEADNTAVEEEASEGNTAPATLYDMVEQNDTASIQKMFNLDVNLDERNPEGRTPLQIAVQQNKSDIVEILLKQGASVNLPDNEGRTALHYAVEGKVDKKILSLLSAKKADFFAVDKEGVNPVQIILKTWAIDEDKLDTLFNEENIALIDDENRGLMHYAALAGDKDYIEYFISRKAPLNIRDFKGMLPLDLALQYPDSLRHARASEALIAGGSALPMETTFSYLFQLILTDNVYTRYDMDSTALHIAAGRGHLGIAELILEKGLPIDIRDKAGNTALHEAIRGNQYEMVQFLVNKGADVNAGDFRKNTSLHIALGDIINTKIINFLLIQGANPNKRNDFGNTPLHIIVSRSIRTEIARSLLQNGADIDGRNRLGNTPLMECVMKNNRNLGMLFLQNGADIFAENNKNESPLDYVISRGLSFAEWFLYDDNINSRDNMGNTPLITALKKNIDPDLFRLILDKNAQINVRNKNGDSPLHIAVRNDRIDLADILLRKRADLFALNNKGESPLLIAFNKGADFTGKLLAPYVDETDVHDETPLSYAAFWGYEDITALLITLGADPDKGNINGDTPLHKVVQNQNEKIALLLLDSGANPNAKNKAGNTPLHDVVYWNSRGIADILITRGAAINALNTDGKTALHEAVNSNNFSMCQYLIDKGAYVNPRDNTGTTPLHYAVEQNFLNITKLLIDKGADLLTRDKWGNTLLHDSIAHNNRDISLLLLESGSDIFARNKTGETPLDLAIAKNIDDIRWFFTSSTVQARDNIGNTVLHIALYRKAALPVIKAILDEGADPRARNSDDQTCIDLANELKRDDVIPFLEESE